MNDSISLAFKNRREGTIIVSVYALVGFLVLFGWILPAYCRSIALAGRGVPVRAVVTRVEYHDLPADSKVGYRFESKAGVRYEALGDYPGGQPVPSGSIDVAYLAQDPFVSAPRASLRENPYLALEVWVSVEGLILLIGVANYLVWSRRTLI
jgi:hypothetical protein